MLSPLTCLALSLTATSLETNHVRKCESLDRHGRKEVAAVLKRIEDVEAAIKAVKTGLIATLPKMPRAGRLDTNNLSIDVLALSSEDEPLAVEAA